jgi:hypothetical protein
VPFAQKMYHKLKKRTFVNFRGARLTFVRPLFSKHSVCDEKEGVGDVWSFTRTPGGGFTPVRALEKTAPCDMKWAFAEGSHETTRRRAAESRGRGRAD